jgi:Ala-tRNA(Pro) deacylase
LRAIPGGPTKNLFLRDKNGKRHFIVSVPDEKQVDIKALESVLGASKLSFGSPERLLKFLGVQPGSVTLLGLINDKERGVEVYIDQSLWAHERIQCHPLVNTATITITPKDMERFFECTGHTFRLIEVPSKEPASATQQ